MTSGSNERSLANGLAFRIQQVCFSYDDVPALREISLQVRVGEQVALVGANGSGKSTLLRLLAGLNFPERGEISFLGEPLTRARLEQEQFFFRFRRTVGVVFQNPDIQLFNASVFDEVAFGPLQMRWSRTEIRERVEGTLNAMGILELRDRAPHRLSGGEKKRVAIASVLVLDPEILLLDEPTSALDPKSQAQIVDLLSSWRNGAKTVIIATHDLDTVEDIADRCCILDAGKVAADGKPLEILHQLELLKAAKLIRPQHHVHDVNTPHPHPHLHLTDIT